MLIQKDKNQKIKTTPIPREMRQVSNEVHRSRITKRHYKGREEVPPLGLVDKWENRGVEYLVTATNLESLKINHPRVYTDQKKNLYLLVSYVYKQKSLNNGKATTTFTIGEYLKAKGYTDEEIRRGGNHFKLAAQVIESGANTRYSKVQLSADKKRGRQIIGSFYNIYKEGAVDEKGNIKGKGTKYQIIFNSPYAEHIEKVMKSEEQFYLIPNKLIKDRYLDSHPTLFNFIDHLIFIQGFQHVFPKNIRNLLTDIGVQEKYLIKEKEKSFQYFRDCLVYAAKKYPELLQGVTIYSSDKALRQIIDISLIPRMEHWTGADFKAAILNAMGESDFRKCHISFLNNHKVKPTVEQKKEEPKKIQDPIISDIMYWVNNGVDFSKLNKITKAGTEKFISDAVRELSIEVVKRAFNKARSQAKPNPFRFITKTIPELLRGYERIGKTSSIQEIMKGRQIALQKKNHRVQKYCN